MRVGIVGCSINGAYLAYRLAKDGHDVTVFEAKSEVGGKPCSGLVSERLWGFVPRNDALVENSIDTVELRFPKKRTTVFFNHKMLALNRGGLDKYAAKLAEEAGAKIKTGHRAVKIISLGRLRPHLVAENGGRTVAQEFDRIIGCDGANSMVREYARAEKPSFRLGLYAVLKRKSKKNSVEVSPTENGFKWKIPRGETTEVGIIEKPEKARKIFRRAKQAGMFSAIIPEGLSLSKDKRFALCGDAAGLTKPWSGGGIIWGMTAADLLADSKLDITRYNRSLERHFGPKIFFSKFARTAVYLAGKYAPFLIPKKAHMDSDWLY
jgi:flavin-dependent dehydrogenase